MHLHNDDVAGCEHMHDVSKSLIGDPVSVTLYVVIDVFGCYF